MADIYRNAFLTIAAIQSPNSTFGCYTTADKFDSHHYIESYKLYVRRKLPAWTRGNWDDRWPLLDRAWAFQEFQISPRIIHFGNIQVRWECKSKMGAESGVSLFENKKHYSRQCDGLEQGWHDLVQYYSQLALTSGKDRLPALAALAQEMSE
jgi:hypothetical protein